MMKQYPQDFWNERYSEKEFVYGTKPNAFFKQQLAKLKPQIILLRADGEGRNAVYAATQSSEVTAFEMSSSSRDKAPKLAVNNKGLFKSNLYILACSFA